MLENDQVMTKDLSWFFSENCLTGETNVRYKHMAFFWDQGYF